MKNLGSIVKTIDAYPKTLEDFTVKTFSGAIGACLPTWDFVFLFFKGDREPRLDNATSDWLVLEL